MPHLNVYNWTFVIKHVLLSCVIKLAQMFPQYSNPENSLGRRRWGRRSLRTSVTSDRNFYIVGILRTAKEEFLCTEKHVSIVHVTITTLNLEFVGRNIYGFFLSLMQCLSARNSEVTSLYTSCEVALASSGTRRGCVVKFRTTLGEFSSPLTRDSASLSAFPLLLSEVLSFIYRTSPLQLQLAVKITENKHPKNGVQLHRSLLQSGW